MNDHQRRAVNIITVVIAAFTLGYQIGERITETRWIKALTDWETGYRKGLTRGRKRVG